VRDHLGPVHLELSSYRCTFFVYRFNRCDSCQFENGDIRNSASHARRTDTSSTRLRKPENSGVRLTFTNCIPALRQLVVWFEAFVIKLRNANCDVFDALLPVYILVFLVFYTASTGNSLPLNVTQLFGINAATSNSYLALLYLFRVQIGRISYHVQYRHN